MYNIKDYQLCSTAKKQTKLQRECRWIRVRRILQNSISLGTRVALDFRQALRSHQFPLILRSPPGTNSFSSWIDAASGIYLSIALKIRLRWPMGYTQSYIISSLKPCPAVCYILSYHHTHLQTKNPPICGKVSNESRIISHGKGSSGHTSRTLLKNINNELRPSLSVSCDGVVRSLQIGSSCLYSFV